MYIRTQRAFTAGMPLASRWSVSVTLKLPESLSGKKLGIIYIADNGKIQEHTSSVNNGYISFTTTHFSNYAIFSYTSAQAPKTGDNTSETTAYMLFLLLSATAAVAFMKKRNVFA